ncbi:LEA type 2 family protein [Halapricum desulfuricans]|uniref:LEA14-like dessication related protein n=1 Tax=Halapricum desulfuricans TaxID=2841257 RepID=A0A897MWM1_9EURY|nr:LEA type 2 family protein [Halapricum desulfuricans]QSG04874.1 LEA14-like dessication related protein [Halapricum desulfuricans]
MDLPEPVRSVLAVLPSLRTVVVGAVVSLGVVAMLVTVLVATGVLAQPTVESIDTQWGDVTNETTQIETQARVDNPNPIGTPDVVTIEYTASLNDVVLVDGERAGIGLSPGENTVEFAAPMDNDRIADWWVTHVNGDERSTLTIEPKASGPGVSQSLPEQTSTVATDLLSSFESAEEEAVTVDGEPLLVLGDRNASWGEATDETTPLTLNAELDNAHDRPVTLSGVEYVVTMNNVTLGEGTTADGVDLSPGESGTLTVDTALETDAFADWWPTHVRNDETSRMRVTLYGLVERNGEQVRVPVRLYQQRLEFETDLLGDDGTNTEALSSSRDSLTAPVVRDTDRDWGTITDETTEVHADVTVDNPTADPAINDFVRLTTTTETSISGVDVGSGSRETTLSAGTNDLRVTTELDNGEVPTWWARHLNRGETSQTVTTTTTTADVGFTTVNVPTPDANATTETDLLADLNTDESQPVGTSDREYLLAESTTATWGEATPQVAPLDVQSTLRNQRQRASITIQEVSYDVSIGGVTLANGSQPDGTTIEPGEREVVDLTIGLDNSRMDEWWVSHVRNGERSTLSVDAWATIEAAGQTETVPLSMFATNGTVETDLLG